MQTFNAGPAVPTNRKLDYNAGSANSFGVRSDRTDKWWNAAYDLSNLLVDEKTGRPLHIVTIPASSDSLTSNTGALRYTFKDTTVALRAFLDPTTFAPDSTVYLPVVRITTEITEECPDHGEPYLQSMSTEVIVALDKMTQGTAQWSVYFMGMERMKGRCVRLTIVAPSGRLIYERFRIQ